MSERSNCDEATRVHRAALCEEKGVTLNGRPAQISGAALRFAIVSDRETGLSCEFAWSTVERVLDERQGAFRSN